MVIANSAPLTPDVIVAFVLSLAGIVYTLTSRNGRAKRIVFPVTLFVFYAMAYTVVRRAGGLGNLPAWLVPAILVLGAIQTLRIVRFCANCGRTMVAPWFSRDTPRCQSCRAAVAS